MSNPFEDLSPAQIERLKTLAELTPDQLETMRQIIKKESSWTFVRSYLKGLALWVVAIAAALSLFWDNIKAIVGLALPPNS